MPLLNELLSGLGIGRQPNIVPNATISEADAEIQALLDRLSRPFVPPGEAPPEPVPKLQSGFAALGDALAAYGRGVGAPIGPTNFTGTLQAIQQRRSEQANQRSLQGATRAHASQQSADRDRLTVALSAKRGEDAKAAAALKRKQEEEDIESEREWNLGLLHKEQDFAMKLEEYRAAVELKKEEIRQRGKGDRVGEMLTEHNENAAEEIALTAIAQRAALMGGEETRSREEVKREFLAMAKARFRGPDRETYLREQELNWEESVGSLFDETKAKQEKQKQLAEASSPVNVGGALPVPLTYGMIGQYLKDILGGPSSRAEQYAPNAAIPSAVDILSGK